MAFEQETGGAAANYAAIPGGRKQIFFRTEQLLQRKEIAYEVLY